MNKPLAFVLLAGCALFACANGHGDAADLDGGSGFKPQDPPVGGCTMADQNSSSVGCDYYAIHMDGGFAANNGCFVAFLANTSSATTHVKASFAGMAVDLAEHARIPSGSGRTLTYDAFDPGKGLEPGQVAILFLAGPAAPLGTRTQANFNDPMGCPVTPAFSTLTQVHGTGRGMTFHIETDSPVVAYQMLPYGGGSAAVTGATLLRPTTAWGKNYIAVNAYLAGAAPGMGTSSMNIVASQNGTKVRLLPKVNVEPGGGLPGTKANTPVEYELAAGEMVQFTQSAELTGSPVEADKPVAVFAGQPCLDVPVNVNYCDHAEQQIPPIAAMGHEFVAAPYRQRSTKKESVPWRIIGAVDGTQLTYSKYVGGPATVGLGDVVELTTSDAFSVRSQDAAHPFLLVGYMTGASSVDEGGYGDADFVRVVPTDQYLSRYVFFTDPSYPETNLVVTRKRGDAGYADVKLDCAGTLSGWQPLDADHEFTRIDLVRHDFQGQNGCDNGRHEMLSTQPFGLTVWGWGSPETSIFTGYVSYGYPAGENVATLNDVVVPVTPR